MSIDAKEFLNELRHRQKGKLAPWELSIFQLLAARASYADIVAFLSENGVRADRKEVYSFVHRTKRRHLLDALPGIRQKTNRAEISPMSEQGPPPQPATAQSIEKDVPANKAARQHELPKFDWQALKNETKDVKW